MKEPEYVEGPQGMANFEEGTKALFKVSQRRPCRGREEEEGKTSSRARSVRKPKLSDKD